MKRKFTIIISVFTFSFLVFYFCSQTIIANNTLADQRTAIQKTGDSIFTIYKIDSINNYYLIYGKKDDTLYKIVSKNTGILNCEKIKLSKDYFLSLNSIWRREILIGGVNVSPSVTPHVTCLYFNDSTAICLERDSINDLYEARNLQGLCIKK